MATAGEQLAKLREARGVSQNALARLINKSQTYVRNVEIGDRALSNPETITSWAAALDVDEDTIYAVLGRIPPDIVDALTVGDPEIFGDVRRCLASRPSPE